MGFYFHGRTIIIKLVRVCRTVHVHVDPKAKGIGAYGQPWMLKISR
jgi:hypothetical protein